MDPRVTDCTLIYGVILAPLRIIRDARGAVLHMLRADSPLFQRFGEVYFSEVRPGVVKAWKRHRVVTQHLAVPVGRVKFAIYDDRTGSPTRGQGMECVLGHPDAYQLLVIPPLLWYGFRGLGDSPSIVANCTDFPHDPNEAEQVPDYPGGAYLW